MQTECDECIQFVEDGECDESGECSNGECGEYGVLKTQGVWYKCCVLKVW